MSDTSKKTQHFLKKRRNTIVFLVTVFTVLIVGYFALRGVLIGEVAETTPPPSIELLPGEATFGDTTLIYPRIDRENIKTVKIHNPNNRDYGEVYVDWGIGFAKDPETKNTYGYLLEYDYAELDDTQLAYFAMTAGYVGFTSRVTEITADTDLSVYGLQYTSDEEATYMVVEKNDGTKHKIYFGKKNPNGTAYYVRSGDTYQDENGNTVERNTVYLLDASTSTYASSTVLAKPTAMLTTRMTYPVKSMFSSFVLQDTMGELNVAFVPVKQLTNPDSIFGGSSLYYTVLPQGYFSSAAFETRITIFEDFLGEETLEYATKRVDGVDEETGEAYTLYTFDEATLAKYHLDSTSEIYCLMYTAAVEGSEEDAISEVYFSRLQPDGYYYAYSLSYGTIVRVSAAIVDFLEWDLLDFVNTNALTMSIGYCDTLTIKGTLENGVAFHESFSSTIDADYRVLSAKVNGTDKTVPLEYYRVLFQELYNTVLRGEVPEDLDKEALMQGTPYAEFHVKTRDVTVYVTNAVGAPTSEIKGVIKSVTRIVRFYRYSNNRTLMTIETIQNDGTSTGESGAFYVLASRLDKIVRDADKLIKGIPFSFYDKE